MGDKKGDKKRQKGQKTPYKLNIITMTIEKILQREALTYTSESVMGADFYQWAHNTYLNDLHGMLFHVPNEIPRAKGETQADHRMRIQHLTAQGLVSGVEDYIYIGEPARNRKTVLIELKTPSGTVSKSQREIHARHIAAGHIVFTDVRKFSEWRYIIEVVILGQAQQQHHTIPT
jgi:hypothetical protein